MELQELGPIQEAWLKELETTKEWQGKTYLSLFVGGIRRYCCLGIYCKFVARLEPIDRNAYTFSYKGEGDIMGHSSTLPDAAWKELGLYSAEGHPNSDFYDPEISLSDDKSQLTMWNDFRKATFKEIAAMIRRCPQRWFREPR